MKKLLTIMLSVLMVCALGACSKKEESEVEPTETATAEATETATAEATETATADSDDEYNGSSVIDGDVEIKPVKSVVTTNDGKKLAIVDNFEATIPEGMDGLLAFGNVTYVLDVENIKDIKEKLPSEYSYVASFSLMIVDSDGFNNNDQELIKDGVNLDFAIADAKEGDTYYALHVNNDGSYDTINCTVSDGIVTINDVTNTSLFIIVKA